MRWLGVAALGAVIAQGVLGGLTVLLFLPAAISTAHAGPRGNLLLPHGRHRALHLARLDAGRHTPRARRATSASTTRCCARVATATTALIYTQILVGATMRHTGAGLAIPDFPLMFGHLVPDHWDAEDRRSLRAPRRRRLVALAVMATSAHVWYHHRAAVGTDAAGDPARSRSSPCR